MPDWFNRNRWLIIVITVSVLIRIAAAWYFGDQVTDMPGTYDQISYHTLAVRVLEGHGFSFGETWWPITPANAPTAHWSFLYTLYLVGVYGIFGVHPLAARVIQALITGILQPYLTYQIGSLVFNRSVAFISAIISALYAYFIYYDATLMTEPFFITSLLAMVYIALLIGKHHKMAKQSQFLVWFGVLGLFSGLAILLRQLMILIIPFILIWLWWVLKNLKLSALIRYGLVSILIVFVMILPFTIYNTIRFGHFVFLNTNSGYAFFWANHPVYGTRFQPLLPASLGTYQDLIPQDLRSLDEAALDQALLKQGMQFVLSDPIRYVLLSISRIPVFFMFWPSADSELISNISRVASFGLMLPFMIYGVILLSVHKLRGKLSQFTVNAAILIFLISIVYTGIHLLSWALVRYRLPVDSLMILFAGYGITDILNRVFRVFRLANLS